MASLFKRHRWRSRFRNGKNGNRHINKWLAVPLILFGIMVVGAAAATVAGFIIYRSYADDLVPIEEVLAQQSAGGAKIYDRNGRLLYEYMDDLAGLRQPVPLSGVSKYLIDATVATEDSTFYSNPGVNIKGLLRAAYENFFPGNLGFLKGTGGSSITQQLEERLHLGSGAAKAVDLTQAEGDRIRGGAD